MYCLNHSANGRVRFYGMIKIIPEHKGWCQGTGYNRTSPKCQVCRIALWSRSWSRCLVSGLVLVRFSRGFRVIFKVFSRGFDTFQDCFRNKRKTLNKNDAALFWPHFGRKNGKKIAARCARGDFLAPMVTTSQLLCNDP